MQPTTTTARRRELERSLSWPVAPDTPHQLHKTTTYPQPSLPLSSSPSSSQGRQQSHGSASYEDDLHSDPQNHFLSPIQMYEYEYDYDSYDSDDDDSDDDGTELEWDAGITDFALFTNDRRAAEASHAPLPSKWSHLIAQQADALQRAVMRNREDSNPDPVRRPLARQMDGVPGLTPDASPEMRDEGWEGEGERGGEAVPDYLHGNVDVAVSDSGHENAEGDDDGNDDDELLSPHFVARKQMLAAARRGSERKVPRPGMRHSRTMSGQVHAWRRPSWGIYTVGEEGEGEGEIEEDEEADEGRGRGGRRR